MDIFEYNFIINDTPNYRESEKIANVEGSLGWELIHIHYLMDGSQRVILHFKRKKVALNG
jgi:hypothetical protein